LKKRSRQARAAKRQKEHDMHNVAYKIKNKAED
jgi:hypothetical protein